ncbi:right-handed parallel beta-helix repeat-containing protein [Desulfosoma sp.]
MLRLKDGQTLWGDGADHVIIDGSSLQTPGLSPVLILGKGVRVVGIQVRNTPTGSGLSAAGDVEAAVYGVVSRDNAGGGAVAYHRARLSLINTRLSGNAFDGATAGAGGVVRAVMCSAIGNRVDGFGAEEEGQLVADFDVAENNGGVGFGLFTGSRGTISRSLSRSNAQAGIHCGPETLLSLLERTLIVGNGTDGVGMLGPNAIIETMQHNAITGNRSGVTLMNGARIHCFRGNHVAGNQSVDFYTDPASWVHYCDD